MRFVRFLYFPWLFTVGVGSFLMGCPSVEVFWFVVFRPVRSSVLSTHSTGRFGVGQGQRVLARGRREPISKSCEITQADNLNRRRRLSRKAQ